MDAIARSMFPVEAREDQLAARCRSGDMEALEELYRRWDRPIFRYAYGMLAHVDEADDAKQETFLRAFRSVQSFDGRCALHTWLFGICSNVCKDRLKQRSRRPELSLERPGLAEGPLQVVSDPAGSVIAQAEFDLIMRALYDLPDAQREILLLREVEGLTYVEIRDVFRCSIASVKLRLFRARQQWRRRYQAIMMSLEGDA